jgi:hypothetical protein
MGVLVGVASAYVLRGLTALDRRLAGLVHTRAARSALED